MELIISFMIVLSVIIVYRNRQHRMRGIDFKHEFSASDIVYSISAILERRALNEEEEEVCNNW